MRKLLDQCPRVFLIDPTRDEAFDEYAPAAASLAEVGELSRAPTFRARLVTESQLAFDTICWLAFEHRKNCLIAVDEIHEFVPCFHASIPPWFRKCVLRGRHEGVSIIGASQRTANCHNDFLFAAAAHRIYVFRTPTEDLGGLKKYKHFHRAADLPNFEHLTWPPPAGAKLDARGRPRARPRARELRQIS